MTKYQLAKVILMAGGIESRKRIQKTVHLLQAAGCPLDIHDFRIHYYGPYSKSLARLVDEMTSSGILNEKSSESEFGTQYDYQVDPEAEKSLQITEKSELGRLQRESLVEHADLLDTLSETRPRVLELASTIVGFIEAGNDWDGAVSETAEFKKESEESGNMEDAKELAETVLDCANGNA